MKLLNVYILLFVLVLAQFVQADPNPRELIEKINKSWRSSSQFIDDKTITDIALKSIPRPQLQRLSQMPVEQLKSTLESLARIPGNPYKINKGVAENLIKIRTATLRLKRLLSPDGRNGEVIFGINQARLDSLTEKLPAPNPDNILAKDFDYAKFELQRAMEIRLSVNDLYAIKIAALHWSEGFHKTVQTTAEVFPRGRKTLPLMAIVGQDMFAKAVPNLKFSEADIQHLRNLPSFSKIDSGFWDYLRTWRFTGSIDMVPPGTLVGPDTPVMQIRGNPVDITLIETPLLAFLEDPSRAATYAFRAVEAGQNQFMTEGGARRGMGALLRSLGAIIGGFKGTATVFAARLLNTMAAGSAQNHATAGHFPDELALHTTTLKYFAREESFLLTDTFNLERGIKLAIRAGGSEIKGFRVDSTIPGKNIAETIEQVNKWLEESGFARNSVRVFTPGDGVSFTDDLNESSLYKLNQEGVPFQFALLGGRFKNGEALGFVMKASHIRRADGTSQVAFKMANPDKPSWPGEKNLFRETGSDGLFKRDLVTQAHERLPSANFTELWIPGVVDGKCVVADESIQLQAERLQQQRSRFSALARNVTSEAGAYPLHYSDSLRKLLADSMKQFGVSTVPRIGVFPLSGDPFHEGHAKLVRQMKSRYMLDKVYIVLTGSNPIHGKVHSLPPEARLARAQMVMGNEPGIIFDTREIRNPNPKPTVETMEEIEREQGRPVEMFLMGGEDFANYLANFVRVHDLVSRNNIILAKRRPTNKSLPSPLLSLPREIIANHQVLDQEGYILRSRNGKVIELGDYPTIPDVSSTGVRTFYDELPYSFAVHITDPQETFLPTGSLPVAGTELTIDPIVRVAKATLNSGRGKLSISKDSHHPVEVADASQNGEFHAPTHFPPHGMKGQTGPHGDQLFSRLQDAIRPYGQISVPHHSQAESNGAPRLQLDPFDLSQVGPRLLDPAQIAVFDKNGPGSYSVFANPRFDDYLPQIDPYKLLPHFELGNCTDFCNKAVILGKLERGYNVFVIVDAMAGVLPAGTASALEEMNAKGAKFITTKEFLNLSERWHKNKAKWNDVLTDLHSWEKSSKTKARVLREIRNDKHYTNEAPVPGRCNVVLLNSKAG